MDANAIIDLKFADGHAHLPASAGMCLYRGRKRSGSAASARFAVGSLE
jgi:ribosomal protein S11